jgi:hypothetical protein
MGSLLLCESYESDRERSGVFGEFELLRAVAGYALEVT